MAAVVKSKRQFGKGRQSLALRPLPQPRNQNEGGETVATSPFFSFCFIANTSQHFRPFRSAACISILAQQQPNLILETRCDVECGGFLLDVWFKLAEK